MSKPVLWSKDFIIITLTNFLLYSIYYLLMVTIATFAMEKYHASPSIAGLVSSIFVLGIMVARLICGHSIYRIGQKKMLFIGFVLYLLTTLAYFIVEGLGSLLLVRLVNGAAMGVASTATGTIVAGIIPKARRGEGIGYYSLGLTLALAAGPFFGLMLMEYGGFKANLIACLTLLAVSFITVFFVRAPEPSKPEEEGSQVNMPLLREYLEPNVVPIAVFAMMIGLCYSSVLSFLNAFLKNIQLVEAGVYFFLIYAVFVFISRPYVGVLFDRKGENYVIYPSIACLTAGIALLSATNGAVALLLAGGLVGIGYSSITASVQTISIKIVRPEHIALATSTIFIFLDIGVGIGPYLLGFLISGLGYRGMYVFTTGLLILSFYIYHHLHGKKPLNPGDNDPSTR